jgi:hypothetical protein
MGDVSTTQGFLWIREDACADTDQDHRSDAARGDRMRCAGPPDGNIRRAWEGADELWFPLRDFDRREHWNGVRSSVDVLLRRARRELVIVAFNPYDVRKVIRDRKRVA